MAALSLDTVKAIASGAVIASHTGNVSDGATAAGYSLWVQSITSTLPKWERLPDKRARIYLDESQRIRMRSWIEAQVKKSLTDKTKPSLETDIGAVLSGAGLKWGVIAAVALMGAGAVGLRVFDSL